MKYTLQVGIILLLTLYSCKNNSQVNIDRPSNQLINETSPYLLQHAYNPVDWHPWGPEALEKAEREGKLLIISVGYSACHWCHVMEHESFEDSTVAAIMNEHFVPIKVDREERPDVDDIYMTAAHLISGRGGWPLNAFAMPDGRPIWAGTYFPKDRWLSILNQFADLNKNDRARLEDQATQLTSGIQSQDQIIVSALEEYAESDVRSIGEAFFSQLDMEEGGRKGAPKFPMPNNYEFLLKYGVLYDDANIMEAVQLTLNKMARGGIYDHAGGGFARYSVDAVWKAPHFEKMMYDNGQLVSLYSQAYRHTKSPLYKRVVLQTLAFIEREMTDPDGGFYTALDADSEGEEGKFYVWRESEIDEIITDISDREIIKRYYSVTTPGNWEHGNNILHVTRPIKEITEEFGISQEELVQVVDRCNALLMTVRSGRERPGLDDKILTSLNALMIKGYVDAYKAFGNEEYLEKAVMGAHFILQKQMSDDARLNRNYKNGRSSINGFLDDYGLLIDALLAVYEVTFDESWINISKELTDYAIEHFYDDETKMFFYTSNVDPPLVARKMEVADNVIASSNSIMARVLNRLGEMAYDERYISISDQMMANMWPTLKQIKQPSFYSNWLQLLLEKVHPSYEVAVVGKEAIKKAHTMMKTYHPDVIYLGSTIESQLPLLLNKYVDKKTMIYVCQNKACKLPVEEINKAFELMK